MGDIFYQKHKGESKYSDVNFMYRRLHVQKKSFGYYWKINRVLKV
jgi:hypothetical protein